MFLRSSQLVAPQDRHATAGVTAADEMQVDLARPRMLLRAGGDHRP